MKVEKNELTYPQKNIWLVEKFNENSTINYIIGTVEIKKDFCIDKCEKAINSIIKNNDAMKIRISLENDEPIQTINKYEYEKVEVVDLSLYSDKEKTEFFNDCILRPLFSDKNEKLYDFKILKYSEESGAILMRIHHIISDAWSCSNIGSDLIKYVEEGEVLSRCDETKPSYLEYINSEKGYMNSEKFEKSEMFWRDYLKDLNETVSLKENSANMSTNANRYSVKLDNNMNEAIDKYCKENKVSPYSLFLAAISTYIYRVKDKNDIVLGTPVLNRTNFKEKQMLGMFVSTLPIRIKVEENEKFIDLTKEISSNTLSIFRHQKYPYSKTLEYIHKNTDIKSNLYNVVVSYQNARADMIDKDKYSTTWKFVKNLNDEIQIHIMDMDSTGVLNINYDYKTDLFEDIEIEYIHSRIMSIIENAIEDNSVDVENIRIMTKEEENKILYEFNDTNTDYPKDKTVIELFEEQVKKNPNNIALVFEGKEMTYSELNKRANQVAYFLREEKGIKPNDVVGLVFTRSFEMIIAILGVLKSGGAYLPIDPEFPKDRIEYMITNSNVKEILTNVSEIIRIKNLKTINIVELSNSYINNLKNINRLDDLIYIIYTSGTTGNPKGVMITHDNVLNLMFSINSGKRLHECKTAVSITKYSFDMFVIETLITMFLSKKIVLANEYESIMPNKITDLINDNNAEILFITPSKLSLICEKNDYLEKLRNLKRLTIAGEMFNYKYYTKVRYYCGDKLVVFNGYGPSETTVCSNMKIIDNVEEISIGRPIKNVKNYILDKKLRILPLYVEGELVISGKGVGKRIY